MPDAGARVRSSVSHGGARTALTPCWHESREWVRPTTALVALVMTDSRDAPTNGGHGVNEGMVAACGVPWLTER